MRPVLESAGMPRYEDFAGGRRGEVVARSRTTETRRFSITHDGTEHDLYLKVFCYGAGHRRPWFVRDKAASEAANYRVLREQCGVATPDVIAFGSRRGGPWLRDAFLLTRAVSGAFPMGEYVRGRCNAGDAEALRRRRRLADRLADVVAAMHAAGFHHVDLQWRNILVREDDRGEQEVFIIDCPRGGIHRLWLRQWHGRLRDLSSLHKSARGELRLTEQVRWLRRYLGVRRLRPMDRVLVQAIRYDRDIKENDA